MSSNVVNAVAYLRTTREFPEEMHQLCVEANKAYLDTANAVNVRTIGIFPTNRPAIGGESWYLQANRKQQSFRQVYQFTAVGSIPHGLNMSSVSAFTKSSGSFTDGTNWYGVIYGSNVAIAGQISFYITPANIVILAGGGSPTITSGFVVIEWISQA